MDAFPTFTKDELDEDQLALWNEVTKGARGFSTGGAEAKNLPGLYNSWLMFPSFGLMMMKLGDEIRRHKEIPGKLREMVVITTSALLKSPLELKVHSIFAKVEGLPVDVIKAIQDGAPPPFTDPAERIVYDANVELVRTGTLSDETRAPLVELLGKAGLIQFIALVGLYTIVSYTINVSRVELPVDWTIDESQLKDFLEKARA